MLSPDFLLLYLQEDLEKLHLQQNPKSSGWEKATESQLIRVQKISPETRKMCKLTEHGPHKDARNSNHRHRFPRPRQGLRHNIHVRSHLLIVRDGAIHHVNPNHLKLHFQQILPRLSTRHVTSTRPTSTGVQQGSTLGPVLFSIHINNIPTPRTIEYSTPYALTILQWQPLTTTLQPPQPTGRVLNQAALFTSKKTSSSLHSSSPRRN